MVPKGERSHYLVLKKSINIFKREITSRQHNDFYCLNCLYSFGTESKREYYKKVCKDSFTRKVSDYVPSKFSEAQAA